VTTAVELGY